MATFSPVKPESSPKVGQNTTNQEKPTAKRKGSGSQASEKSQKKELFEYKGFSEGKPISIKEQMALQIKRNNQSH